jgi:HAMP domain-containing protein
MENNDCGGRIAMTDDHKITLVESKQIQRTETQTHPFVAMAIQSGNIDTQTMREMMTMQREWEADEARKAFTNAMVALHSELPTVLDRDKEVSYGTTRYTHTSLGAAVELITPNLTKYGFSHSWKTSTDNSKVKVTCRITHAAGHYEETYLDAPPDNSGHKSSPQAIASTVTLLERYTLLALLGIATADMQDPRNETGDNNNKVDLKKNLKAVAELSKMGISSDEACNHVNRAVEDWTSEDLQSLRDMVRSKREPVKPTPKEKPKDELERMRQEIYEMAQELNEDPMPLITKLFAARGATFMRADKKTIADVMARLSVELDKQNSQ